MVSFIKSVLLFATPLNGTEPEIMTAAIIEKAFSIIWKIRWFLNTTTIKAMRNLLNKKNMGYKSEILPESVLKSSKTALYCYVKSAIFSVLYQLRYR
jgi:hypothetical protein